MKSGVRPFVQLHHMWRLPDIGSICQHFPTAEMENAVEVESMTESHWNNKQILSRERNCRVHCCGNDNTLKCWYKTPYKKGHLANPGFQCFCFFRLYTISEMLLLHVLLQASYDLSHQHRRGHSSAWWWNKAYFEKMFFHQLTRKMLREQVCGVICSRNF